MKKREKQFWLVMALLICIYLGHNIYKNVTYISPVAKKHLYKQIMDVVGEVHSEELLIQRQDGENVFGVYEDVIIEITFDGISSWKDYMPKYDKSGIPLSTKDMITIMDCNVTIKRYIKCNDVELQNHITKQYLTFKAFEDRDSSSEANVVLDISTMQTVYSDSKEYFNDLESQILNAMD